MSTGNKEPEGERMIENLKGSSPEWLNSLGPYPDIVFLSKVSLYRNIEGYPFNACSTDEEKREILKLLMDGIKSIDVFNNVFSLKELSSYEKKILFERCLISQKEMRNGTFSGVALNDTQNSTLVLNSDEHLRISSISSGFELQKPFNECDRLDDALTDELDFVFDKELGFLTSSPKRVGTGLEISIFIYLPAVVITGAALDLIEDLERNHYLMEGTFRDKGGIEGSLFHISNQFTLGVSEEEIIRKTEEKIKEAIQTEFDAREYLMENARYETEDKIWRSYGIITNARFLNLEDFLNLASAVRLGVGLGLIKDISILDLNKWTILSQPGHIRFASGGDINSREENILRAKLIRKNTGG